MSGLERADGSRGWGSLPRSWGVPPGDQFSEERARWVRERVREEQRTAPLKKLAARDARLLAELRLMELEGKANHP